MTSLEGDDAEADPKIFERFIELLKSRPLYDHMLIGSVEIGSLILVIQARGIAFDSHCPQCNATTTWRVADRTIPGNVRDLLKVGA